MNAVLASARAREGIQRQRQAILAHEEVGKVVRKAIQQIGGELPEDIPAAEHIKRVEKRVKAKTPRIELEQHDAAGLLKKRDES